jgi:hypothetical protein
MRQIGEIVQRTGSATHVDVDLTTPAGCEELMVPRDILINAGMQHAGGGISAMGCDTSSRPLCSAQSSGWPCPSEEQRLSRIINTASAHSKDCIAVQKRL